MTKYSHGKSFPTVSGSGKTHEMSTHTIRLRQAEKKSPRQNLSIRLPSHTYLFMSVYAVFIPISRHGAKEERSVRENVLRHALPQH